MNLLFVKLFLTKFLIVFCSEQLMDSIDEEEHLLERVKRGMAQRYTYRECYLHWLKDFEIQ